MPGHTACFRCGSVLDGKAVAVDVHPPRAPGWKKPLRQAARWMRHRRAARQVEHLAMRASARAASLAGDAVENLGFRRPGPLPPWPEMRQAMGQALVALALSIVPGGAQLAQHRFPAVRLYVLSWFASLAIGIFFFGSSFGIAAISSAIVVHAWIAMDAVPLFERKKERMTLQAIFFWRLAGVAVLAVLVYGMYRQVRNVVASGVVVGQSGIAVKAYDVELRDSILCRRLHEQPPPLKRGDLVLVRVRQLATGDFGDFFSARSGETVGQLIGLPGDVVELTRAGFIVNGQALDPEKFPAPAWLRNRQLATTLGKMEYFVTMEYRVQGEIPSRLLRQACVYASGDVEARGFMLWFPLLKRGFLKELE